MTLTDRDKKVLLILVPILLVVAYWFFIFSPRREEASKLGDDLAKVEQARDDANSRASLLENARSTYAKDYETVVRVGKAIPSSLDMPSLIVQLDQAAKGTGIRFKRIKAGERVDAPPPATPAPPAAGASESAPGQARDAAQGAAATSDQASAAAGAAPAPGPEPGGAANTGAPGLESVPLEFSFSGTFFDLAEFFHRMKRFVRVANERVRVDGRLMSIDGFTFESTEFPTLKTEVKATVYLAPKSEGTTAGATPAGPSPVTQQAGATQPATTAPPAPAGGPAPASAGSTR